MKKILLLLLSSVLCASLFAQKETSNLRHGNKAYENDEFADAETEYRDAIEKDNDSFEGHYNLGNSLYRQDKYADAIEEYKSARDLLQKGVRSVNDVPKDNHELLSQTYHNMGNAYFALSFDTSSVNNNLSYGYLQRAAEAYKNSLRLNPSDDNTRYNLVRTQMLLKQNQSSQQQQQDQQQQQNQQQQNQQPQPQQDEMSDETAEQILQALEQDEKDTQEKVQQLQQPAGNKRRIEKDW